MQFNTLVKIKEFTVSNPPGKTAVKVLGRTLSVLLMMTLSLLVNITNVSAAYNEIPIYLEGWACTKIPAADAQPRKVSKNGLDFYSYPTVQGDKFGWATIVLSPTTQSNQVKKFWSDNCKRPYEVAKQAYQVDPVELPEWACGGNPGDTYITKIFGLKPSDAGLEITYELTYSGSAEAIIDIHTVGWLIRYYSAECPLVY